MPGQESVRESPLEFAFKGIMDAPLYTDNGNVTYV